MDWQPVLEKFKLVQRNPVFRTLSSVRLAIPVMGTLGVVVAWGTILESRYGAAYAKLAVYEQNWFWGLIGLIWLNVLFAALSRIPYKKQHTGFVITHLGILILLAGSFVTGKWGIDGSLRIVEGGQGNHVQLPSLVLEVAGDDIYRKVEIQKSLWPQEVSDLTSHNDELRGRLRLFRYLPFAKMESGMEASVEADAGVAVGFLMKSPFFQVSEWLHETERPVYRMGPAVLRLVTSEASSAPTQVSARANPVNSPKQRVTKVAPGAAKVLIRSATDGKVVKTLTVGEFKKGPVKINGVEVSLVNVFQRAVVSDNRLAESEEGKENPALELKLYSEGKASREVVYGLFPQFSLHPNGAFGLRFEYQIPDDVFPTEEKEDSQLPEGHVPVSSAAGNPGESNVIEFIVPKEGEQLVLRLLKNGEEVLRQQVSAGQSVQTPWMGMTLTLGSLKRGVAPVERVTEAELEEKEPLPLGAVQIIPSGKGVDGGVWIQEGESRELNIEGKSYRVRFGPDNFRLPFSLQLKKFIKTDYPGSSMAQEYESHVVVSGTQDMQIISMNEPLKRDGFTLYQSSFEQGGGRPTASIFSVNRDPGRFWKYLGSLIMSIGIIVYTLHRSRLGRQVRKA